MQLKLKKTSIVLTRIPKRDGGKIWISIKLKKNTPESIYTPIVKGQTKYPYPLNRVKKDIIKAWITT